MNKAIKLENTNSLRNMRNGLRPISIVDGELKGEEGYVIQYTPTKSYANGESFFALVELSKGTLTCVPIEFIKYDDVI